jgi:AAA15 family ATPase/GTPase
MLLRFTVENAYCFGDEATFAMTATADDRHPSHVAHAQKRSRPGALRAAAIYGANAHGKSNFVNALAAMKSIVGGKRINIPAFKLDPDKASQPSRFVIEFRQLGADYEYGLVRENDFIHEEWLFMTPLKGRERMIFKRSCKKNEDGSYEDDIDIGSYVKRMDSPSTKISMQNYLEVLMTSVEVEMPFICECATKKVNVFLEPFEWITKILTPVHADSANTRLHQRAGSDAQFLSVLERYMSSADVGIANVQFVSTPLEGDALDALPARVLEQVNDIDDRKFLEVGTADGPSFAIERNSDGMLVKNEVVASRLDCHGKPVRFSVEEESSGTRRLVQLVPMIYEPDDCRVYVVDELDRKLHPLLAYNLIESFLDRQCGQLIFTTHNTYLMDLTLLRRDEIFFVQKKQNGSSEIYSLSDLKVRPDLDIQKGYLHGRFGAIPFLGNMKDLGWSIESK